MANHKRKKSKRNVKCTICTTFRWMGNTKERFSVNTRKKLGSLRRRKRVSLNDSTE